MGHIIWWNLTAFGTPERFRMHFKQVFCYVCACAGVCVWTARAGVKPLFSSGGCWSSSHEDAALFLWKRPCFLVYIYMYHIYIHVISACYFVLLSVFERQMRLTSKDRPQQVCDSCRLRQDDMSTSGKTCLARNPEPWIWSLNLPFST